MCGAKYSMNKKIGGLTEFEERRTLGWGDFLETVNVIYPVDRMTRGEKNYLKELVSQGHELQEQLNEDWLDHGLMPFQQYAKQMFRLINSQDNVIQKIINYRTELQQYVHEDVKKRKKVQV